jgi:hypothetical protein
MTIPLTGAGSLGVRLGHLIGASVANASGPNDLDYYYGTTLKAKINTIETDFKNGTALPATLERLALYAVFSQLYQSGVQSFLSSIRTAMQACVTDMANTDLGLPVTNPVSTNAITFPTALPYLINQMNSNSTTFNSSTFTLGSQTAVGTPNGNPIISLSNLDNQGRMLQYAFSDTFTFTCTSDSQANPSALNTEPLAWTTPPAITDPLSPLWPSGSGSSGTLTCTDATANVSSGNLLTNSDFETWPGSSSPPLNWNLLSGSVANVDVIKSSTSYSGTYSLELTCGTSSTTLAGIVQPFGASPGTTSTLIPLSVYAINFVDRVSAIPAAGVLEVALVDGNNNLTVDASGNSNHVLITLSGESSTTFTPHQAYFRTPALTPSVGYGLRVRLSTAMDTGKNVLVDHLAMQYCPTPMYTGGPYAAAFSMSSKLLKGDQWTFPVTQAYGLFQQAFERMFQMRSLALVMPNTSDCGGFSDLVKTEVIHANRQHRH